MIAKLKEIKEIKIEKIEIKEMETTSGGEPSGQTDLNLLAVVRRSASKSKTRVRRHNWNRYLRNLDSRPV